MEPSRIIQELQELTRLTRQGVEYLYEAEQKLAHAESELDLIEAKSFLTAEGTVAERQAISRVESHQRRLERDLARAEVNRIRFKLKALESEIMANATISKLIQAEMKL